MHQNDKIDIHLDGPPPTGLPPMAGPADEFFAPSETVDQLRRRVERRRDAEREPLERIADALENGNALLTEIRDLLKKGD